MCASETVGGSAASSRTTFASCSGSCGASRRSGCGASGAGPTRKNRSRSDRQPLGQPAGRLLHAPVLGQPPCQLLRGLLGLELRQLRRLVLEEPARLQLQQRRDEDEELAAGIQIQRVALGEPLEEAHDDPGDVHVRKVDFLLEDERQEQVEGAFEGVQVQVELTHDHRAVNLASGADAALGDGHRRPGGHDRPGRPRPVAHRSASG